MKKEYIKIRVPISFIINGTKTTKKTFFRKSKVKEVSSRQTHTIIMDVPANFNDTDLFKLVQERLEEELKGTNVQKITDLTLQLRNLEILA